MEIKTGDKVRVLSSDYESIEVGSIHKCIKTKAFEGVEINKLYFWRNEHKPFILGILAVHIYITTP